MKKKLIGFILCGLILATAAGCSDTPTQVGQINNSSMESADVTSDREDKDNSDDFTAEKDQLSQTADSASFREPIGNIGRKERRICCTARHQY